ncbi:hypothetical protein [Halodesulfovibrio sp.]|uniref:hypothetical protein n=1 Tax=Halodesulfovibrio sp. TaxID=1912772 RepID=UPI0025BA465B|nr:hypothetical protein [Halodesulfovibrio sp.]
MENKQKWKQANKREQKKRTASSFERNEPQKKVLQKKKKIVAPLLMGVGILAASICGAFWGDIAKSTSSDSLSESDIQRIEHQYQSVMSSGATIFLPVNLADPGERERAKKATMLPPEKAEHMMLEAEGGYTSLAWVTLWDDCAEDGDIVEVSAGGMKYTVPILHKPTTIVVPYSLDNAELKIRGVRDGGGGITIAAKTSVDSLPIPPMVEGEVRTLRFK